MAFFPTSRSLRRAGLALTAFACSAVAAVAAPSALPRSSPEAQGVSSAALLALVDEAERTIDSLHSIMVVRHGHVIAEGWWAPYVAEEPHMLFSLSKSFTSTAVGLAVADGKLSVDDPVLKFFPGEAPEKPSANLKAMRVRDLLTMATGQHSEDFAGFSYTTEESVVRRFLALPVAHKPGTFFAYNTAATYMLSAIVQQVTGQTVLDYLRPRLFEPLGIEQPTWEASKQGVSMGGFGLSIRTEDIARFGQLYLQRGVWQGKQLVPASWVEQATARWMSNGSNPESDWEQGYGFQFWRCRHGAIRGDGAHGQFCVILPVQGTVVALTAGTRNLQGVLNVLWPKLLPALQSKALPEDPAAFARLRTKLSGLTLPALPAGPTPALAPAIAGRRFLFAKNPQSIESIALAPATDGGDGTALTVRIAGEEQRVNVTPREWVRGELAAGPTAGAVALRGAWVSSDTFALDVVRYRTPFTARYRLKFAGDQVTLATQPNVGPTPPPVVGRRE